MISYLKALSQWEIIESEVNPPSHGPNSTVAQMKIYEDVKPRKPKALTSLHSALSDINNGLWNIYRSMGETKSRVR